MVRTVSDQTEIQMWYIQLVIILVSPFIEGHFYTSCHYLIILKALSYNLKIKIKIKIHTKS